MYSFVRFNVKHLPLVFCKTSLWYLVLPSHWDYSKEEPWISLTSCRHFIGNVDYRSLTQRRCHGPWLLLVVTTQEGTIVQNKQIISEQRLTTLAHFQTVPVNMCNYVCKGGAWVSVLVLVPGSYLRHKGMTRTMDAPRCKGSNSKVTAARFSKRIQFYCWDKKMKWRRYLH